LPPQKKKTSKQPSLSFLTTHDPRQPYTCSLSLTHTLSHVKPSVRTLRCCSPRAAFACCCCSCVCFVLYCLFFVFCISFHVAYMLYRTQLINQPLGIRPYPHVCMWCGMFVSVPKVGSRARSMSGYKSTGAPSPRQTRSIFSRRKVVRSFVGSCHCVAMFRSRCVP
jgi:hypothetical protein